MQTPLKVTFKNLTPSDAIRAAVEKRVAWLEGFCDRIIGCHVIIEQPHHRQHQGNLFNLKIHLTVPGDEIVVDHSSGDRHEHEDVQVVVRDAFDKARRLIEEYARLRRGQVKQHEGMREGHVAMLNADKGFGFIEDTTGRRVYFHQNSLRAGEFDELRIGTLVQFTEEPGEQGPQAGAVKLGVASTGHHTIRKESSA